MEKLSTDLDKLETSILPQYLDMVDGLWTKKDQVESTNAKLLSLVDQRKEILHREINAISKHKKSNLQKMKTTHLSALNKNIEEVTQKSTELIQIIDNLKSTKESNDTTLFSTYKSRNAEFRTLPPSGQITLPSFNLSKYTNHVSMNCLIICRRLATH
jgi:hypothetical protein